MTQKIEICNPGMPCTVGSDLITPKTSALEKSKSAMDLQEIHGSAAVATSPMSKPDEIRTPLTGIVGSTNC